jgi:diguanylate cyclase (GGDEF)-like protein
LLLIDLDNFKTINDKHGHLYGDRVLQVVAKCISQNSRNVDISGRYGGDEFVILLPKTPPDLAQVFAERLCQIIPTQLEGIEELTIPVTLSIGIASFSGETNLTFDALLDRADEALYIAKQAGRNQFAIWQN